MVLHEVYEYQVTQYDPQTINLGLFVQYIDILLKLTAEAYGYPRWIQSPSDEDRYITNSVLARASIWIKAI